MNLEQTNQSIIDYHFWITYVNREYYHPVLFSDRIFLS